MEQKIYDTDNDFDFTKISISQPSAIQGGAYITKIKYDENPLYIQTPKCLTKQGLNETNKKAYIDLMYSNEYNTVIEWFENLESALVKLIYEKRELWFQNEMEMEDIENFFNPVTRAYKGGKYHLVRINIPKNKTLSSQYSCSVYDENENMIAIQDLTDSHNIIPCLEVQSIKFSARNFQVDLIGKQIMILNNKPLFASCMIKRTHSAPTSTDNDMIDGIIEQTSQNENTTEDIPYSLENGIISSVDSLETIDETKDETKDENDPDQHQEPEQDESHNDNNTQMRTEIDTDINSIDTAFPSPAISDTVPEENINENHLEDIVENNETIIPNDRDSISLREVSLEDITNDINVNNSDKSSITLNNPNDVYHEIYKIARQKAKEHKKAAITHYLEAKKIKNTYLLDGLYQSDDSSSDEEMDSDSDEIKNQIDEMVEELA